MNDERMQPLLDAWFTDRDEAARDTSGDIARVMADVPRTPQRGRWWSLPVFDRPVSTFPRRELAPAPIPKTNGPMPARGFTMFSAVKFMVASVIVALFGGFLLINVTPMPPGDGVLPAAVTESPSPMTEGQAAVMVTGRQSCDFRTGLCTFDLSDPRVTGTGTVRSTGRTASTDQGVPVFVWDEVTIDGPDGTWSGHHYALADEEGTGYVFMLLSGADAYEGWQFVATGTDPFPYGSHDLIGALYEGPVPPVGAVVPGVAEE